MDYHTNNVQYCTNLYLQCLNIINVESQNINNNLTEVIDAFINILQNFNNQNFYYNYLNYDNNIDIVVHLNVLFFNSIHNLTMMNYNQLDDYVTVYNSFHNHLNIFYRNLTNIIQNNEQL